jgi:hypothetical protein
MKEKQKVWVVSELCEHYYKNSYNIIIGVYTDKDVAYRIYNRSISYSIDEVELNVE